jgi:hypothetical protein
VIGVVDLVDVVGPLTLSELNANESKAGFAKRLKKLPYKRTFSWVLLIPSDREQGGSERCTAVLCHGASKKTGLRQG